jgi:hypothetical protein
LGASEGGRWFGDGQNNCTFFLADLEKREVVSPSGGFLREKDWIWFSPDGRLVVPDRGLDFIDEKNGQKGAFVDAGSLRYQPHGFSADGRILMVSPNYDQVQLWDVAAQKSLGRILVRLEDEISLLALSPSGQFALAAANGPNGG